MRVLDLGWLITRDITQTLHLIAGKLNLQETNDLPTIRVKLRNWPQLGGGLPDCQLSTPAAQRGAFSLTLGENEA